MPDIARRETGKAAAIARQLRELLAAGELPGGQALAGTKALAGKFGVSPQTVDRALGQLVADGLIVRKRGSGTWPVRRCRIGFLANMALSGTIYDTWRLIPEIYNNVIRETLRAAGCQIQEISYQMLTERHFSPQLLRGCDGVIFSQSVYDPHTCQMLMDQHVPCVCFSPTPANDMRFSMVTADWTSGFTAMFERLEKPETREYFLWDREALSYVAKEFLRVAARFGVADAAIHRLPVVFGINQIPPLEAYKLAICRKFPRRAVHLAVSDMIGFGILDALHDVGLRREDFELISCDNLEARGCSPYPTPRLTAIEHPKESIGRRTVQLLLEQLRTGDSARIVIELPTSLVIRESGLAATAVAVNSDNESSVPQH